MPKPAAYLRGFGISEGMTLGQSDWSSGFVLEKIHVQHVTVKRYREYKYIITMVWHPLDKEAKIEHLLIDLDRSTAEKRRIVTQYGNPYLCDFGDHFEYDTPSGGTSIVVTSVGHCHRV